MGHEKVEAALEANRAHQAALTAYVERLQAELETVDSLLVRVNNPISWKQSANEKQAAATIDSDESSDSEAEDDARVHVAGAAKPGSLLISRELLMEGGPFTADARWKRRYDELTSITPSVYSYIILGLPLS